MFRFHLLQKYLLAGLFAAAFTPAVAQSTFVPLNQDVYHLIDRYHIKYGNEVPQLHTAVRPFERKRVAILAETADSAATDFSRADQFNIDYLLNDNWNYTDREENESRKPFLKYFYRNKSDLYHYEGEDFSLRVNPVLHLEAGRDRDTDGLRYINTRGVQVEGSLDDRIGFYTFLGENQAFFPGWVNQRIRQDTIVPHEAYWKPFKDGGYDFFTARGYINVRATKHVSVQFGHDQNFIGDGYRSLLLSDYAPSYFFLKLNTQVWKLNYQNLFTEMIADHERRDQLYPKKYMAMHHLSYNILPNLNVGVYEAVVFARDKGQYELQYLNPIIFYRSVEQWIGSEDNALVGANFKWNIKKRGQLYGQVMLDEFLLSEVRAGNGWWANKQGFQLGAKYIDVAGVKNLDAQVEYNYIRPFTYSHQNQFSSYTHYQQPMAHPIGANMYEFLGILRYQPLPRLQLTGKAIFTHYGQDTAARDLHGTNWGTNPIKSYNTRVQTHGNEIGQGLTTDQIYLDFTATWQLRHNLFIDLKQIVRRQRTSVPEFNNTALYSSFALRWNIPQRLHEF